MVTRRVAVTALLAAALLLGVLAYFFTSRDYTPDAPRPSFVGSIAFASTDDFGAFDVTVTPVQDPSTGAWSVLHLSVATTNVQGPVAIGLTGDARVVPLGQPPEGGPVSTDQTDAGMLWAEDLDAVFSPGGRQWPWRYSEDDGDDGPPTDVIVGRMDFERCANDQCGFDLSLPLSAPVISGEGGTWTVSSPNFGVPLDEDPLSSRSAFLYAEPRGSPADERLKGDWLVPSDLDVRLDLGRHTLDSVQTTGSAPVPTVPGLWRGQADYDSQPDDDMSPVDWPSAGEVLKVDATFQRPQVQQELVAKDGRQQFYAGIALSLAASLLMWAAEMVVGPRLYRT